MKGYPLLRTGLVSAIIVLTIGVLAARLHIPYAVQIIVVGLGAITALIQRVPQRATASHSQRQSLSAARRMACNSGIQPERRQKAAPLNALSSGHKKPNRNTD
jgi:hypothetical protein